MPHLPRCHLRYTTALAHCKTVAIARMKWYVMYISRQTPAHFIRAAQVAACARDEIHSKTFEGFAVASASSPVSGKRKEVSQESSSSTRTRAILVLFISAQRARAGAARRIVVVALVLGCPRLCVPPPPSRRPLLACRSCRQRHQHHPCHYSRTAIRTFQWRVCSDLGIVVVRVGAFKGRRAGVAECVCGCRCLCGSL